MKWKCMYELSNEEWKIVKDLSDVLKVCTEFLLQNCILYLTA